MRGKRNENNIENLKLLFSISNFGFTLAEVLVVLGIIGVVAALTIPVLMQKTYDREAVTGLKKAYSTLINSYNLLVADYGDIVSAMSDFSSPSLTLAFKSKMKLAKYCGRANSVDTDCFPDKYYKYLDGTTDLRNFVAASTSYYTLITTDNIAYAFYLSSTTCSADSASGDATNPLYYTCGSVYVDVNGPNKGPSIFGRDLFRFFITNKTVYPQGAYYDSDAGGGANCTTNGAKCTSKVLKEDAINY